MHTSEKMTEGFQQPFTIEQIKAIHSKVKSGADFPQYVQDIIKLGVTHYEAFVADGHTDYYGSGNYKISSAEKYDTLAVAGKSDIAEFTARLKTHQQGHTDYATFCKDCAVCGVEKWILSMNKMTCAYYDKAGNELLVEIVPAV